MHDTIHARVKKDWDAHVSGKGDNRNPDFAAAMRACKALSSTPQPLVHRVNLSASKPPKHYRHARNALYLIYNKYYRYVGFTRPRLLFRSETHLKAMFLLSEQQLPAPATFPVDTNMKYHLFANSDSPVRIVLLCELKYPKDLGRGVMTCLTSCAQREPATLGSNAGPGIKLLTAPPPITNLP